MLVGRGWRWGWGWGWPIGDGDGQLGMGMANWGWGWPIGAVSRLCREQIIGTLTARLTTGAVKSMHRKGHFHLTISMRGQRAKFTGTNTITGVLSPL